jgi:hypothetical protein
MCGYPRTTEVSRSPLATSTQASESPSPIIEALIAQSIGYPHPELWAARQDLRPRLPHRVSHQCHRLHCCQSLAFLLRWKNTLECNQTVLLYNLRLLSHKKQQPRHPSAGHASAGQTIQDLDDDPNAIELAGIQSPSTDSQFDSS